MNKYEEIEEYIKNLKIEMLTLLGNGKSGHIGGAFSSADMVGIIYKKYIQGTSNKFIFSKGHIEILIYALLINEKIITIDEKEYKQFGSVLQGHPSGRWIQEVEYSPGSLGQGLSVAIGMAMCGKKEGFNVFCLIGDGELQEGQIWEGLLSASKLGINNLFVLVDCNGYQLEGETLYANNIHRLKNIAEDLGWKAKIVNGHNLKAIEKSIKSAKKPSIIFAKTVKGNGLAVKGNLHSISLTKKQIRQMQKQISRS